MFGLSNEKVAPPILNCPSHTRRIFDITQFPGVVEWAERKIKELDADAIVACGHSGLTIAGAVSYQLEIPIFAVRKEHEDTVAGSGQVSGIAPHGKAQRWVWLDDFISSGSTFARSAREVFKAGLVANPFPIGCVLYGERSDLAPLNGWDIDKLKTPGAYHGEWPRSIARIGYLS